MIVTYFCPQNGPVISRLYWQKSVRNLTYSHLYFKNVPGEKPPNPVSKEPLHSEEREGRETEKGQGREDRKGAANYHRAPLKKIIYIMPTSGRICGSLRVVKVYYSLTAPHISTWSKLRLVGKLSWGFEWYYGALHTFQDATCSCNLFLFTRHIRLPVMLKRLNVQLHFAKTVCQKMNCTVHTTIE